MRHGLTFRIPLKTTPEVTLMHILVQAKIKTDFLVEIGMRLS